MHGFESLVQLVPAPTLPSAGQLTDAPLHVSATSQTPELARHVLPDKNESAGHAALAPVQFSTASHAPAAERHGVLPGRKESSGQAVATPSQVSATSQLPLELRHCVPALPAGCWQALVEPSH